MTYEISHRYLGTDNGHAGLRQLHVPHLLHQRQDGCVPDLLLRRQLQYHLLLIKDNYESNRRSSG